MRKIKWGILSTATIAVEQVIPAIQQSQLGQVWAIASRREEKAKITAHQFDIPHYHKNYEELLNDPEVDAVYIPLPNHLHVKWATKALRAGKHVLVEKPVAMNVKEAQALLEEAQQHPELKIMEAFMYKFHPQWIDVKQKIREGAIGNLEMIQSSFSFFDDDPASIVNVKEYGGGSLMDVGCYPVSISRYLFDAEPIRVLSTQDFHSDFGVDVTTSGILEFEAGRSIFFSSIGLMEHQEVKLFGTRGKIEFEIPFNPPRDRAVTVKMTTEDGVKELSFGPGDQYSLQTDAFSRAIIEDGPVPVPLNDAVQNMKVIEAIKENSHE